jgi:3',5'-cyclic-AMP phosphodiesterase
MTSSRYWLLTCILAASCKQFMFHPNEVRPSETALNSLNIEKISALEVKPSFKFILTGDTQRFYDELDAFVDHVNSQDSISFVLLNGDLVDFGLNKEFNWIAEQLKKLKVPYICAMGNHDMLGNGRKIFHEMFGPENFSFFYGKNKFICLNTNSRETGFDGKVPDTSWLRNQITNIDGSENVFILSHVPPFNADFDKNLESSYVNLLASQTKVRISLHGHEHRFRMLQPYPDSITYLVAAEANQRKYAMIEVENEHFTINERYY